MDLQTIENIVRLGEGETIEFKKSTSQLQRSGETLCAFLNDKGGKVLIGISATGKILGQDVTDKTLLEISNMISKIEPSAPIDIEKIKLSTGKEVIVLTAQPIEEFKPFTFNGKAYQRIESSTVIMPRSIKGFYCKVRKKNFFGNKP